MVELVDSTSAGGQVGLRDSLVVPATIWCGAWCTSGCEENVVVVAVVHTDGSAVEIPEEVGVQTEAPGVADGHDLVVLRPGVVRTAEPSCSTMCIMP